MKTDEAQAAVRKIMECHETIRRLFPTEYREKLAPHVNGLRSMQKAHGVSTTSAAITWASMVRDDDPTPDVARVWIFAAAAQCIADEIEQEESANCN